MLQPWVGHWCELLSSISLPMYCALVSVYMMLPPTLVQLVDACDVGVGCCCLSWSFYRGSVLFHVPITHNCPQPCCLATDIALNNQTEIVHRYWRCNKGSLQATTLHIWLFLTCFLFLFGILGCSREGKWRCAFTFSSKNWWGGIVCSCSDSQAPLNCVIHLSGS